MAYDLEEQASTWILCFSLRLLIDATSAFVQSRNFSIITSIFSINGVLH